jgi:hypothetical protein
MVFHRDSCGQLISGVAQLSQTCGVKLASPPLGIFPDAITDKQKTTHASTQDMVVFNQHSTYPDWITDLIFLM